jgi:hypothetical protein
VPILRYVSILYRERKLYTAITTKMQQRCSIPASELAADFTNHEREKVISNTSRLCKPPIWSRIMAGSLNIQKSGISPIASETRGVSAETGFLNSFIRSPRLGRGGQ